jgi:acetyl esterase/lipase
MSEAVKAIALDVVWMLGGEVEGFVRKGGVYIFQSPASLSHASLHDESVDNMTTKRNIPYLDDGHTYDLYQSSDNPSDVLIVFIHGGAWRRYERSLH